MFSQSLLMKRFFLGFFCASFGAPQLAYSTTSIPTPPPMPSTPVYLPKTAPSATTPAVAGSKAPSTTATSPSSQGQNAASDSLTPGQRKQIDSLKNAIRAELGEIIHACMASIRSSSPGTGGTSLSKWPGLLSQTSCNPDSSNVKNVTQKAETDAVRYCTSHLVQQKCGPLGKAKTQCAKELQTECKKGHKA